MAKASKPSRAKKSAKKAKPAAVSTKRKAPTGKRAGGRKRSEEESRKRTRKPSRKGVRVPRLPRAELQRRLDAARAAATRGEPAVKRWMRGLEFVREHLSEPIGRQLVLKGRPPPPAKKGTPWALVAMFGGWDGQGSYTELHQGLEAVDRDERIVNAIGKRRLARMTVLYKGVVSRGDRRRVEREFTLAEISPWEVMVSRALERTDPTVEDSLVARYDSDGVRTLIKAVFVWIALEEAREANFLPH